MNLNLVFFPALSDLKDMVYVVLLNYIFKLCVMQYVLSRVGDTTNRIVLMKYS